MVILCGVKRRRNIVLSDPCRRLAAPRRQPDCSGALSRIYLIDDVPVARWGVMCGQPKQGFERNMAVKATIVAKNEFIKVGVNITTVRFDALSPPNIVVRPMCCTNFWLASI